jgi:hypothetical protein
VLIVFKNYKEMLENVKVACDPSKRLHLHGWEQYIIIASSICCQVLLSAKSGIASCPLRRFLPNEDIFTFSYSKVVFENNF